MMTEYRTCREMFDRTCRCCGCTDSRACLGGCSWVLLDIEEPSGICSACAEKFGYSICLDRALEQPLESDGLLDHLTASP